MGQPYFYVRSRERSVETRGAATYFIGHKIPRANGTRADGVYVEWSWDGKRLTAHNGRYGLYPVFYYYTPGELILSPSLREVLAQGAPNELDYDALSVFLRLGFFVGEDTPFKHIKVLPPDATFLYEDGKLTVSGQYAFRKPIQISKEDTLEEYTRLFRQSIQRRLPAPGEKFLLPLSGGRDSRHILLELCHQGHKPDYAVTMRPYPPYSGADIETAKTVCEALGVKHLTLEHKNSYFVDEVRSLEMTNYCSDEQTWFLALADHFKGRTNVSYDGIAGDVFPMSRFWNKEFSGLLDKGRYAEICRTMFHDWSWMRPNDNILKWSLEEDLFKKTGEDRAVARVAEELKKFSSVHNSISSFYFWNRARRKIGLTSYGVNTGVPVIHSPFLDHDLYDFLAALPQEKDPDGTLHDRTIESAYPRYAHIPYAQYDAQKRSTADHQQNFTREFAWHALTKNDLGSSRLLKGGYLWPRMVKGLLDKKYRSSLWRLMPPVLLYLMQLEKLQNMKRTKNA